MSSWFEKIENPKLKNTKRSKGSSLTGVWKKCTNCKEILSTEKLIKNNHVCPNCGYHYRISWKDRVDLLFDKNSIEILSSNFSSLDPLKFKDKVAYTEKLKTYEERTGEKDSVIRLSAKIDDQLVSVAVMNFSFMGGSMGTVCGEEISRAFEYSLEKNIPCIVISASGGARMQEGILSLMQMAKTLSVRKKLREKKIPYISILTDPTTGGVAASFAMLGDVNITEPNSLIGFAGPRVIEQSMRQKLPEGFQKSEFLKERGFVDQVIHRHELKEKVSFFIKFLKND